MVGNLGVLPHLAPSTALLQAVLSKRALSKFAEHPWVDAWSPLLAGKRKRPILLRFLRLLSFLLSSPPPPANSAADIYSADHDSRSDGLGPSTGSQQTHWTNPSVLTINSPFLQWEDLALDNDAAPRRLGTRHSHTGPHALDQARRLRKPHASRDHVYYKNCKNLVISPWWW